MLRFITLTSLRIFPESCKTLQTPSKVFVQLQKIGAIKKTLKIRERQKKAALQCALKENLYPVPVNQIGDNGGKVENKKKAPPHPKYLR